MNLKYYDIELTSDINRNRKDPTYQNSKTWPNYKEDLKKYKDYIITDTPKVLLRVYDGEFWFLLGKKVGNVGKRHISIKIDENIISKFYQNSLKCDKFLSHLTVLPKGSMHKLYKSVYKDKKIDYPMEFNYALVLTKWIFKQYKNQIGLMAGSEKIKVIKELMKYQSYRDYLGIDKFSDYISVPERYSCDNVEQLESEIKDKLKSSKSKVFLFGIGISKLYLAHKFKEFHPATYIDIGACMSGLAGFLSKTRPYANNWINYRIKNYDYSNIDKMDMGSNEHITYL